MTDIFEALRLAVLAAIEEYKFVRHLQQGKNPDVLPF
jgi:hypothetical protein